MGLKFSIPGFFSRKIWQVYFFWWLDLRRDLFGYSKHDLDSRDYQMVLDGMMKTNTKIQFLLFLFFALYHLIFYQFKTRKFGREFFFLGGRGCWKPNNFLGF